MNARGVNPMIRLSPKERSVIFAWINADEIRDDWQNTDMSIDQIAWKYYTNSSYVQRVLEATPSEVADKVAQLRQWL